VRALALLTDLLEELGKDPAEWLRRRQADLIAEMAADSGPAGG
jgi:hypothetical protein